jgi:hypothetical protein
VVQCTSCRMQLALFDRHWHRMEVDLLSRSNIPPAHAEQGNKPSHANCVIHIRRRNRLDGWEEQNHANEANPAYRYGVDGLAPSAQGVRSLDKLDSILVNAMRNNDSNIAEIERRRCDVENGNNGEGTAYSNKVETATKHYH